MSAARALLDGADGADVMEALRARHRTPAALSAAITRVRRQVLAAMPAAQRDALRGEAAAALAPHADEPGVAAFLGLDLDGMRRVQRQHASDPTWTAAAEEALRRVALLPANLAALGLSKPELLAFARAREAALLQKQESLLHVRRAGEWLQYALALARASTVEMGVERLALPLLLLSGRRTTEILNGHSTFAPTPRPTTCVFTGALKKRGAARAVEIPLLCDHATFATALGVLRARQGHERLEPAACNARYHRRLKAALGLLPFVSCVHQLRSVYAAFVYHLYACDATFNRAAMRFLLHEKLEVSLSYNAVELHDVGVARGCLGALP
jgi:hypothetical protein